MMDPVIPRVASHVRPRRLSLGLSASLGAHLLFALLLLLGPRLLRLALSQTESAPPEPIAAEMVFVDPGRTPSAAAPPKAATQPQQAQPQQAQPQQAPPQQQTEPPPPPSSAPPPSPPLPAPTPPPTTTMTETHSAPAPSQPPEIRFGDEESAGATDPVQSADLQLSPDPSAPNIPPRYPPVAARLGEQGLVVILVDVQPDGTADVAVFQSSGFPLLDEAARDAVARWRFRTDSGNAPGPGARTLISVRFRLN